jgi:NifU-like protein
MQPSRTLSQTFESGRIGSLAEPNFGGRAASFSCGAVIRVSLQVDQDQRISDARFKAAGCTVLVVTASSLLSQTIGRTTSDAAQLAQNVVSVVDADCEQLARDALLAAIRNYSDAARDDWQGDDPLICTCFCVSERTIQREISDRDLQTVCQVTSACNAGAGCRSCYSLIEDMLDDHRRNKTHDLSR